MAAKPLQALETEDYKIARAAKLAITRPARLATADDTTPTPSPVRALQHDLEEKLNTKPPLHVRSPALFYTALASGVAAATWLLGYVLYASL